MNMTITEAAAARISTLCAKQDKSGLMLRITVLGGGCSGFQYKMDFDDKAEAEDLTFDKDGVTVVIDATSMPFLDQAELDYVEEMVASAFKIRNPNAVAGCSCGNSFTV